MSRIALSAPAKVWHRSLLSDEYNNDIVLVSQLPEDETEKKRSSVLKKKTPRVATIEAPHIERAYVYGKKEAQQRIEQYGEMVAYELYDLGATLKKNGKVVAQGKVEPKNDAARGIGRDYDYGRAL